MNLKPKELKALKSLRKNKHIVIKPADKGSTIVIMNREDYILEARRQLTNSNHYKEINEPVYPRVSEKINTALKTIVKKKLIDKKQMEYLKVPHNARNRTFYLLPQIHKERDKWTNDFKNPPGRPIVSVCSSDTYRVAEYIDHHLRSIATNHPAYIKDTQDFLDKISTIKPSPNSLLITLDVDSLYTNIDNKAGIQAVRQAFIESPDNERPDVEVLRLLLMSLKNNDFTFDDKWYLQISGTAMGKKFAPNYANVFMAQWEKEALDKCPLKPQCFYRYLDDIFIIWPHSLDDFGHFCQILNSHHPNIKLKSNISNCSVDFLDVTVFKGQKFSSTGQLDTKVFFKATDTHELLHKRSYHPQHTFKGIIKSQIIRFKRICNNLSDFHFACNTLFSVLRTRGYAYSFLRKIKRETIYSFKPQGQSNQCGKRNCATCPHIHKTNKIFDGNNNPISLRHDMDCQSKNVIYLIECKSCGIKYVGETCQKLKDRLNQHRSDINRQQQTTIASHFNNICMDIGFLQITPIEQMQRLIPEAYTFMGMITPVDTIHFLQREQFWIKKLKTKQPHGLNARQEIPPPIPFTLQYNDQAPEIHRLVKTFYDKIQERRYPNFNKFRIISSYRRNKNLKDMLVTSSLTNPSR